MMTNNSLQCDEDRYCTCSTYKVENDIKKFKKIYLKFAIL